MINFIDQHKNILYVGNLGMKNNQVIKYDCAFFIVDKNNDSFNHEKFKII